MNELSKLKRLITFHLKREAKIMEGITDLKNPSEVMEVLTHIVETSRNIPALKDWVATQSPEKTAQIFQMLKAAHQKKK